MSGNDYTPEQTAFMKAIMPSLIKQNMVAITYEQYIRYRATTNVLLELGTGRVDEINAALSRQMKFCDDEFQSAIGRGKDENT